MALDLGITFPQGTDEKVKVSKNDANADFLLSKLQAGANITLNEINDGGSEKVEIVASGGGGGGGGMFDIANDAGTWAVTDATLGGDTFIRGGASDTVYFEGSSNAVPFGHRISDNPGSVGMFIYQGVQFYDSAGGLLSKNVIAYRIANVAPGVGQADLILNDAMKFVNDANKKVLVAFNASPATQTPLTGYFGIKGNGATSATFSLEVQNSSAAIGFQVRDDGVLLAPNLPTSSAGLPSGAIWNNSGVLNIV